MIKYADSESDEKSMENMILIDFQFCCFTSPTIDLHYFFNSSLQESLRPNRFDELIAIYHKSLVTALKKLGYKQHIPTLTELKQQYRDKMFYGE